MIFFLPIGTDHAKSRLPLFTLWLVGSNVLLFFLAIPYGQERIAEVLGYTPGAPNPVTAISHMFIHANILHLAANMLFLWLFGSDLEDVLGPARFAGLYFGSGLVALAAHHVTTALVVPRMADVPVIGGSGAIAGVLAVYAVRFWRYKVKVLAIFLFYPVFFRLHAVALIGLWFFTQLLWGLSVLGAPSIMQYVQVAFWAHIGGFAAGLTIALAFKLQQRATMEYRWADAGSCLARGRFWHAIEAYQDIAARHPDDPTPLLQIGRCWETVGDKRRMAEAYSNAFQKAAGRGNWEAAMDAYADLRQAAPEVELAPLPPSAWMTLASIFQENRRLGPALDVYRRIADRHPESEQAPLALLRSADIFLQLGRQPAAAALYSELLDRYPASQWAALAKTRLTQIQAQG